MKAGVPPPQTPSEILLDFLLEQLFCFLGSNIIKPWAYPAGHYIAVELSYQWNVLSVACKSFNQLQRWRKTTCKSLLMPWSLLAAWQFTLNLVCRTGVTSVAEIIKKIENKKSCVVHFLCNDKAALNREVATLQLGNAPVSLLPLPPGIKKKEQWKERIKFA